MTKRSRVPVLAAVTLTAVLAVPASATTLAPTLVTPMHTVGPVALGMSRAAVVTALGRPQAVSLAGALSYGGRDEIFDIYMTRPGPQGRVRQVIAVGARFCAARAPLAGCSLRRGSAVAVVHAYPGKFRLLRDNTNDTIWWWCGRVGNRYVSTSFNVNLPRGRVQTWYLTDQGTRCPTARQIRAGT